MRTKIRSKLKNLGKACSLALLFTSPAFAQSPTTNQIVELRKGEVTQRTEPTMEEVTSEPDFICSDYTTAAMRDGLISSASEACGASASPLYVGGSGTTAAGTFCFLCLTDEELLAETELFELETLAKNLSSSEERSKIMAILPPDRLLKPQVSPAGVPADTASPGETFTPVGTKVTICATRLEPRVVPAHQDASGKVIPAKTIKVRVYKTFSTEGGKPPAGWALSAPANCARAKGPSVGDKVKKAVPKIIDGINRARRLIPPIRIR